MKILGYLDTGEKAIHKYLYTDDFNTVLETRAKIIETLKKCLI